MESSCLVRSVRLTLSSLLEEGVFARRKLDRIKNTSNRLDKYECLISKMGSVQLLIIANGGKEYEK